MRFLRRNSRRTSKKVSITLLFLLVTMMGVGYAYINSTLKIEGTTIITKNNWNVHFGNIDTVNGTLNDNESINISQDKTTITFNINLETIEDSYEIDVDIVNDGGIDAMLNSISLTGLSDIQKEYLEFYATYNNGDNLTINDLLPAGEFDVISVFIKYKEGLTLNDLSNTTEYLNLNLTIGYGQAKKNTSVSRGKNLVKTIASNAVMDTDIDFGNPATTSGEQGVYIISSTKDEVNPVYYYRGAVINNHVRFGGFCWKIVRTTSTGGVKILYNGKANSSGYCNATDTSTMITTSRYSSNYTDNTYMGYMYGKENATTYEESHSNLYDSNIKEKFDEWYANNLISYTNKLEDTVWCNDRYNAPIGKAYGTTGAFQRIIKKSPSVECALNNDSFTVNEKNGNGKLIYPVATMSPDEALLAGAAWNKVDNSSSLYILNGVRYFLFGASTHTEQYNLCVFTIEPTGALGNTISTGVNWIRPMISLKRGTRFISGDGTQNNPYIVN